MIDHDMEQVLRIERGGDRMSKKIMTFVLGAVLVFAMILPALASEHLVLDITSAAKREMAPDGYEWFVKPGTYQGF
jgi:hypothetical protein